MFNRRNNDPYNDPQYSSDPRAQGRRPFSSSPDVNAGYVEVGDATIDLDRENRCGFSEVIYGASKTGDSIARIAIEQSKRGFDVLATLVSPEKAAVVMPRLRQVCPAAYYNEEARIIRAPQERHDLLRYEGTVAIVTAGTSDLNVALEAQETADWMGVRTKLIQDVGVAGPQRLIAKLPEIRESDVIIVVAGMEGALPSVVGGYVSQPIIAVPTSVGYGASFGGVAALLGMMNSCASNVTVVNIDAGFKAGYVAGMIAKRVAVAANEGYNDCLAESQDPRRR